MKRHQITTRMNRRVASTVRLPAHFGFDYGYLSPDAFHLFVCFLLAIDADNAGRGLTELRVRCDPQCYGHHTLDKKRLAAALEELCKPHHARAHAPLVRATDGSYQLADPSRWFAPVRRQRKPLQRHAVFARDGFRCVYCEAPVSMQTGRVDHVIPHSRGGADTMDNLATACGPCNARKSAKTPEEWLQ